MTPLGEDGGHTDYLITCKRDIHVETLLHMLVHSLMEWDVLEQVTTSLYTGLKEISTGQSCFGGKQTSK